MKLWPKIKHFVLYDTYGALATANFLICIVSGIGIAVPFDAIYPFGSVISMMIHNPAASFFRNMHYWSAQFFLFLIMIHIWDQFKQNNEQNVRKGVWFRLTLSVLFTFYVMLSGFILKGDADSLQAKRILDDLLRRIPFAGDVLAYFFIGPEGSFRILYMHHIATATIFLIIITFEHAHKIWVRWDTFFITMFLITLLSLFIQAPLHDGHNPVVKGPWYFTGLQEILHRLKHPGWIIILISSLLIVIWLIPEMSQKNAIKSKRIILYTFLCYGILTIAGYWFRGENWSWRNPWKQHYRNSNNIYFSGGMARSFLFSADTVFRGKYTERSETEGCLICHSGMTGFSPAHDPQAIGCAACHLGNAYTRDKHEAHRGMILIPGNISDGRLTCGTAGCHPDIQNRIQNTLMTTAGGIVTADKFVFHEEDNLSALHHIRELETAKPTASESHLRNLCASCHLGNPKTEPGPVGESSRGGGCNACHLNYTDTSFAALMKYEQFKSVSDFPATHPSLSIKVSNEHCFGCHSRSGRISANYEGWHETPRELKDTVVMKKYRIIEKNRVFTYVSEDVHHEKGMDCIDCHNGYELMGNYSVFPHEEDQVTIRCEDCHRKKFGKKVSKNDLDPLLTKITELRKIRADSFFTEGISGLPLLQLQQHGDTVYLQTKNSGKLMPLTPPAPACTRNQSHDRLSCSACHTSWAPSCIGCHNSWDVNTAGFDLYDHNRPVTGTWIEYTGTYEAYPPTLGIMQNTKTMEEKAGIIRPAIPGMILSIDMTGYPGARDSGTFFHRLYAPAEPHTTSAKGRSCKSCHNNPQAIGYGKGKLTYRIVNRKGYWDFSPRYAVEPADSLPADAWTGFLKERKDNVSTRNNFRPFTLEEQKQILTVGACLTCHEETGKAMSQSLENFAASLRNRTEKCILPVWPDGPEYP